MATTTRKYPQASPHRAPETDTAAECARWRRRAYAFVALALAIAMLGIASVFYFIRDARAGNAALSAAYVEGLSDQPAPSIAPTVKPAATLPLPKSAQMSLTPPGTRISIEPASKIDLQKNRFLEALGSLSAAHLFQSYLNIGLLADGVESEAYTTDEAADTLRSINDVMDQVDAQLDKLSSFGLDADDRASIEQIKTVATLLRVQAKLLQDYWDTNEPAKAEQYHEARKAAWKGLNKVLQVDSK